ncbi:Tim10/DDP family zinc finger-domain-containing protein [Xylaria palmicola]|nr:Tim10/DDP family zinc finger-domain-containing protein [Xylaria palmicola]
MRPALPKETKHYASLRAPNRPLRPSIYLHSLSATANHQKNPRRHPDTMDNLSLENADLDRLNDKDKTELRQFLNNENQKARIQSSVHSLADVCFNKCVTGAIRSNKLDRTEEACMTNCAERFLDISALTMKHLQSMRQG